MYSSTENMPISTSYNAGAETDPCRNAVKFALCKTPVAENAQKEDRQSLYLGQEQTPCKAQNQRGWESYTQKEHSYISFRRIAHFYSSKPQPNQFTVLVRGIPVPSGSSCSETVEKFLTENYCSTYPSNSAVRRTGKLQRLASDADKVYRTLARIKPAKNSQERFKREKRDDVSVSSSAMKAEDNLD